MQTVETRKIPAIFRNMTTSYKAYWFLAILEMSVEEMELEIEVHDLCIRMLANAWYPVHFFRLHFGAYDQVSQSNQFIMNKLNLKADIPKKDLIALLKADNDQEIEEHILRFKRHVLFRFLSPWIPYKSDLQVEKESQRLRDTVPYSINREKGTILVPASWGNYFSQNYAVLKDYCYYQLALYLQAKNPGVPAVLDKLVKPAQRESLSKQREYWNIVFEKHTSLKCIYTHKSLSTGNYDLEHYIPWSFVTHNLIWNLIPAESAINSSKSNKLPPEKYLAAFVHTQQLGLTTIYHHNPSYKLLQDFNSFGAPVSEIIRLENNKLFELYKNQVNPQLQIARQLGFGEWEG